MTQFSLAELFGMTIRESANDGSDFTNPAADYRRLFLGEDGLLHVKDSAGTVTSPYTSSGGYSSGTSFPGGPSNNDVFHRTDLDMLFFYNGTRWLTLTLYRDNGSVGSAGIPFAATTDPAASFPSWGSTYDLWLEDFWGNTYVSTTNDGSRFYTCALYKEPLAGGANTAIVNFTTAADTASRSTPHKVAIGALLANGTFAGMAVSVTKTSTPGSIYCSFGISYRLVGT